MANGFQKKQQQQQQNKYIMCFASKKAHFMHEYAREYFLCSAMDKKENLKVLRHQVFFP